eukprot:scaffold234103_cov33-Tisochrysis_lutea.AAC.2
MGASLIHLLPGAATINKGSLAEVIGPEEELGGAGGPEENEDYPLSYLLCGAAFLVLMLVDSSLRLCLEHERTDVGLDEMDLEHGAFLGHFSKYMHGQPCTEGRGDVNQERKENLCPWWQVNTASVAQCRQHGLEMGSSSCSLGAEGTPMGTPRDDEADAAHDFVDTSATMLHGVSDATANPHTSAGEARASHFAYPERAAEQRVDIHPAQAVGNASSSMLSAIATFTAFSFHGLIEGIALGVVGDVRPLFVAVGAHKAFAAFALGTSISRAYFGSGRTLGTPMVTVAVFCFASLTPIGIFLGRRLASGDGDENNTEEYLTSVLTALAADWSPPSPPFAPSLLRRRHAISRRHLPLCGYNRDAFIGTWRWLNQSKAKWVGGVETSSRRVRLCRDGNICAVGVRPLAMCAR